MCVTALDSTELIIGDRPQYFFDNGLIEEIQNITRTVHAPKQLDENPVLQLDRPWEHFTNFRRGRPGRCGATTTVASTASTRTWPWTGTSWRARAAR